MKLTVRSFLIVLLLYGMVFAVGDIYLSRHGAPVWVAMLFAVAIVGIQYGFGPALIQWIMSIHWDDSGTELPVRNREFLRCACAERGLKMPRIGIIHSNTPNAFTFGHVPGDARVVVTTGLLKILTPEEANAVLAHELGHVEHYDFIVMTLAALAPLLLYQLYVFTRDGNKTRAIAAGAYFCYWISQFLVYLLSRTREYFADQYSARTTGEPEALAAALVKISYGMVQADGEMGEAMENAEGKAKARLGRQRQMAGSLALMGIANLRSGQALALSGTDGAGAAAIMRWDLVNPWARFYQLGSTHPLTALRIRALNRQSEAMHKPVVYPLPEDQRIRWRVFPMELLLWAAPVVSGASAVALWILRRRLPEYGIVLPPSLAPMLLVFTGVSWMLRIWFRYFGAFQPATIRELMEDVDVSQMRTRAVRLEGTILGFGVPGAFWCPDLVLRDSTGMLYVLYRQSIPLARFWFALSWSLQYIDRKVVIEGWFRRGLRPYIEMSSLTGVEGQPHNTMFGSTVPDGQTHRTVSRWVQYGMAAVVAASGVVWLVG